jgi:hypothetical protein
MTKALIAAVAVSVDGHGTGHRPDIPSAGVTHLHDDVLR